MEIGPLIINVIDWLYLAVRDPHHVPTHQDHKPRRQTAPEAIESERRASSLPMSQPPGQHVPYQQLPNQRERLKPQQL